MTNTGLFQSPCFLKGGDPMAYTLSEIRPDDKRGQTKLRTLLEGEGITLDGNLDYTCGLFDEDYQLVATAAPLGAPCAALR